LLLLLLFIIFAGVDSPTPKAVLTGHQGEVTCVAIIAELGMVVSGSKGKQFSPLKLSAFSVC
jgi:hypothetical protein